MQRSAKHTVSAELCQDDVELLQVVSDSLRVEMHFEIYSPVMLHHPFFHEANSSSKSPLMHNLCHLAMSMLFACRDDLIFYEGEFPDDPKMYFVMHGRFVYDAARYNADTENV